jgi:CheY-like chemotaxis protein
LSILDRNPPPERRQKLRDAMRQAAERGANLTRQLLAFSRQKELHAKPVAVPRHVEGMRELLDSSLGGAVTVKTQFAPDVWPVCVDEGELESALLNLCVNARDAMPRGGTVTIAARNRPDIHEYPLRGDFVEISVSDTGEGMDAETISRCLEPFYTTKDVGKGSGLGLAQVYGFVQGSEGTVQIDSKVGQGTRVCLFLPRSEEVPRSPQAHPSGSEAGVASRSLCRVLLVEDDASVASLTTDMLLELGYEVIQVADAQAGIQAMANDEDIGVIVSDVMMPGMDGLSFIKDVRRRHPALPVVLVTGFPDAVKRDAEKADIPLLPKPYALADLAAQLASVLSRPA